MLAGYTSSWDEIYLFLSRSEVDKLERKTVVGTLVNLDNKLRGVMKLKLTDTEEYSVIDWLFGATLSIIPELYRQMKESEEGIFFDHARVITWFNSDDPVNGVNTYNEITEALESVN